LRISLASPDVVVDGDKLRLAQAVGNVVTNAAKYTGPGGTLQISSETRDGRVLLHVADDGMGIDAALLPRVFDAFVQGERSLDRSEGGLGMGLAVAKRLIELHDGTITARSAGEGRGSAFTISLPHAAGVGRAPASAPALAAVPRAAKPLKILVVDDNVDAAQSAGTVLRLMGHDVTVVHDAVAALSTLAADVGVLDIGLRGMDGYELARRIRALVPKMFLVALTGYGGESYKARSREAGFDAHMVKPTDPQVLRDLLDRVPTAGLR
jgi:CheY-like chemotaxis protein/anti-sigma regulatory factor (Ser/Thr protein kinase)